MSEEIRHARAVLEHARVTKVKEATNAAFLGLHCHAGKYPSFFDVVVFDSQLMQGVSEGAVVTVTADLSMRKPKEQGGRWELQLIARKIVPGDEAKAPKAKNQQHRSEPAKQHFVDDSDEMPF